MSWGDLLRPALDQRLRSGLRLVCLDRPGSEIAVVLTLLRGGARDDPEGLAGTAHLTEHLLARGADAAGASWTSLVLGTGGDLQGTTHPDYVEFCTQVRHRELPLVLAAEAARLTGFPDLRPGELDRQRQGVLAEIRQHQEGRVTRSQPWPALGPVLFSPWADAHDPFGDPRELPRITEGTCRAFAARHHHPSRSVVVLVVDLAQIPGGLDAIATALDLPPTPFSTPPPLPGPRATPAQPGLHPVAGWTGEREVGSLGWVVPSVIEDQHRYAALLAVAEHLGDRPGASARVGQMGPMDRAVADALTVTTVRDAGVRAALESEIPDQLARLAGDEAALAEAIHRARAAMAERLDDPRSSARLVGRAALLAGDARCAGAWAAAVQGLEPEDVARAGTELAACPSAGVIAEVAVARRRTITSGPDARTAYDVPVAAGRSDRHDGTLCLERPSRAAAAVLRCGPQLDADLARRWRGCGAQVTRDQAGWVVQLTHDGTADALVTPLTEHLGETDAEQVDLRHAVVVGRGSGAGQLLDPYLRPAFVLPATSSGLTVRRTRQEFSAAHLRWPINGPRVVERWVGLATLLGIHHQTEGADVSPLDAPAGSHLTLRQEALAHGVDLVVDVYAQHGQLAEAMHHLADSLRPPALERRFEHTGQVADLLAQGWQRDTVTARGLAQRSSVLRDLGASHAVVADFVSRLHACRAEDVVEQLRRDTAPTPGGWISVPHPELLPMSALPWPGRADSAPVTAVT